MRMTRAMMQPTQNLKSSRDKTNFWPRRHLIWDGHVCDLGGDEEKQQHRA